MKRGLHIKSYRNKPQCNPTGKYALLTYTYPLGKGYILYTSVLKVLPVVDWCVNTWLLFRVNIMCRILALPHCFTRVAPIGDTPFLGEFYNALNKTTHTQIQ